MKFVSLIFLVTFGLFAKDTIFVVTEHLPPFQVAEGSVVKSGLGYDLVTELLQRVGDEYEMKSYLWEHAYSIALKKENIMIYSMTRSEKRENKFKWVGKIVNVDPYFWKIEDNDSLQITTFEELKNYKIGVSRDDNQHQTLLTQGFTENVNLFPVANWNQAIKMLFLGRIDMIVGPEIMIAARFKELNKDMSKLKKVIAQNKVGKGLCIAFSISTSDEIVDRYRAAYQAMIKDGTYDRIMKKYLSSNSNDE